MDGQVRVDVEEARALCIAAYRRHGVPAEDAARAAEQFILCDLLGIPTHGLRRLSNYIGRIEIGGINPTPDIRVTSHRPAVAVVEGDGGLGTVVASRGLEEGIRRAKENGIAYVSCINSNHFGGNASYGWQAAEAGLVCHSGSNGTPTIAAPGGKTPAIGNNPIGYAAPGPDGRHFILDMALSIASRGKLRAARDKGEPIAEGVALTKDGLPTTDAGEALDGFVLPIGGHKGYGLATAIDILSAVLGGGGIGPGIRHQFKQPDQPSNVSQFFLLIDPAATVGRDAFQQNIIDFAAWIHAQPPVDPAKPGRLPGEAAAERFARNVAEGVPMTQDEYDRLRGLADGSLSGVVPVS